MEHVIEVGDAEFVSEVLERSRRQPVLVDFWAEWCAPCRQLSPVLEKLAGEFAGAFVLAKVDTEKAPQVAAAARIQSIPTVLLFKQGRPVDGFVGVQPEDSIREFLHEHCPTEADRIARAGDRIAERGGEDAEVAFRRALERDPKQPAALLGLARVLARRGEVGEARTLLEAMAPTAHESRAAQRLLDSLDFWAIRPGAALPAPEEGEASATVDAALVEAAAAASAGELERALQRLYDAVSESRGYRREMARRAMVALFGLLGEDSAVTRTWQRRLANLLY